MILITIMTATIMTALDTTIANVALPRMAGSISASPDQISWVLTSYMIASVIGTPMTGWLTGRLGAKQVFVFSIIGFTIASALCGAAQSLSQIVVFRVLQGLFGATMPPLAQAVILDIYPVEERGPALSAWGMGLMAAPILGPVLGGWLTDDFSWRWVFYINLPIGVISVIGVTSFMPGEKAAHRRPLDIAGFVLFSMALGGLQLFLDRGQSNDWFESGEVIIEGSVAVLSLLLFCVHAATFERPFIPPVLLKDRNFVTCTIMGFGVGVLSFAVLALLPTLLQSLMGYPVVSTGLVLAPRGIGNLISILLAGRLVNRMNNRLLMLGGLTLVGTSYFGMSQFSLGMDSGLTIITGFLQGLGSGFVFMPLNVMAFGTLDARLRADGAGVYTLVRNLGSSIGISVMETLYTRNVQVVHARLAEGVRTGNPLAAPPYLAPPFSLHNAAGLLGLNGELTRQASMVSYVDVFHLMAVTTLVIAPLVLILKTDANAPPPDEEMMVME
jgi:DHA2 family multidrug resistance protein